MRLVEIKTLVFVIISDPCLLDINVMCFSFSQIECLNGYHQAWTSGEMKYRAVISTRGSVGEVVENQNETTMSSQAVQHVRGETFM